MSATIAPPTDKDASWKGFPPLDLGGTLGRGGPLVIPVHELSGMASFHGAAFEAVLPRGVTVEKNVKAPVTTGHAYYRELLERGPRQEVTVRVAEYTSLVMPFLLLRSVDAFSTRIAERIDIRVGRGASLTILDVLSEPAAGANRGVLRGISLDIAHDAEVRFITVHEVSARVTEVSMVEARVAAGALCRIGYSGRIDGNVHRSTLVDLVEEGARGDIAGSTLVRGSGRFHHSAEQRLGAGRTQSILNERCAVMDTGTSVFAGLIRMTKDAHGATAAQTQKNLLLSDGARASTNPQLEILADDVQCSHAATVSRIPDEERFYLETRGLPPGDAATVITRAFLEGPWKGVFDLSTLEHAA